MEGRTFEKTFDQKYDATNGPDIEGEAHKEKTSVELLAEFKFCKNCKWARHVDVEVICSHPSIEESNKISVLKEMISRKGNPNTLNYNFLVHGNIMPVRASFARSKEEMCGESGKKFEDPDF